MKTKTMLNTSIAGLLALTMLLLAGQLFAQGASNFTPEWVERSNDIAYKLLESRAKFAPEVVGEQSFDIQLCFY